MSREEVSPEEMMSVAKNMAQGEAVEGEVHGTLLGLSWLM